MSQREDVLFCKIAITNGLISQGQAQKVLSICNKREKDEGRRPLIGAVFAKYNLMQSQEVKKIYEAVNKRTGGSAGPASRARAVSTVRRGGGSTVVSSRRGGRRAKREKQVDPTTLYMGIGFGVVFLGVVITIVVLLTRTAPSTSPGPEASAESNEEAAAVATAAREKAAKERALEMEDRVLPKEAVRVLNDLLGDARRDIADDPERGLAALEKMTKFIDEKEQAGYDIGKWRTNIADTEKSLRDAMSDGADDATAEPDAGAAEPAAEEEEAVEPAEDGDDFDFDFDEG